MPTYEYVCKACDDAFEHFQSMTSDPLADCTKCGGEGTLKRLIGRGAALIFKGSGFYETDYKRSSKKASDKPVGADSSGDRDSRGKPDEGKLSEKVARTKEAAKDVKQQQASNKGGDA